MSLCAETNPNLLSFSHRTTLQCSAWVEEELVSSLAVAEEACSRTKASEEAWLVVAQACSWGEASR